MKFSSDLENKAKINFNKTFYLTYKSILFPNVINAKETIGFCLLFSSSSKSGLYFALLSRSVAPWEWLKWPHMTSAHDIRRHILRTLNVEAGR